MSVRLKYGIGFTLLAVVLAVIAIQRGPISPMISMEDGWEYSWDNVTWSAIEYPSNPPNRDGRTAVWYRHKLPDVSLCTPSLFVYSIDLNAIFYLDGKAVYSFLPENQEDFIEFRGWPWHLILLPQQFQNQWLTVEVRSDYKDIGLFGDLLLGDEATQIRRLYRRDTPRLVVGTLSLVIGIIFLAIFISMKKEKNALYLAIISFLLVMRVLSQTFMRQFSFNEPIIWEYIKAFLAIATPLAITLFVGEIIDRLGKRICSGIALIYAAYFVVFIGGSLAGIVSIMNAFDIIDGTSVAAIIVIFMLISRSGFRGNEEASLLAMNFGIMFLFALYSMLLFRGVLPWGDDVEYLMVFQFSVGLVFILVLRLVRAHSQLAEYAGKLEAINNHLEELVSERTKDLENEKQLLHTISITDSLTNLHNRRYILKRFQEMVSEAKRYNRDLSVILLDVDNFKKINDQCGHQEGDKALVHVAGAMRSSLRESDVCGRYGGEEFLVVLPETGMEEASIVAERIRSRVGEYDGSDDMPELSISGGVAELGDESAEELIKRADVALYAAKEQGRNRIIS